LFSGAFKVETDSGGCVDQFIDRDGEPFKYLLSFLRCTLTASAIEGMSKATVDEALVDAEFFQAPDEFVQALSGPPIEIGTVFSFDYTPGMAGVAQRTFNNLYDYSTQQRYSGPITLCIESFKGSGRGCNCKIVAGSLNTERLYDDNGRSARQIIAAAVFVIDADPSSLPGFKMQGVTQA